MRRSNLFMTCKDCKKNPSNSQGLCHICILKRERSPERQIQLSVKGGDADA